MANLFLIGTERKVKDKHTPPSHIHKDPNYIWVDSNCNLVRVM